MRIEKLAATSEIVSSIAIVATLAYLALQTQQTNQALFSNSRAQIMSADVQLAIADANVPFGNYRRNVIRSLAPNLQLTEAEIEDMAWEMNILAGLVRIREFAWFQYEDGLLDQRAWEGYAATLVRNLKTSHGPMLWESWKRELDPAFVADIDARLVAN